MLVAGSSCCARRTLSAGMAARSSEMIRDPPVDFCGVRDGAQRRRQIDSKRKLRKTEQSRAKQSKAKRSKERKNRVKRRE